MSRGAFPTKMLAAFLLACISVADGAAMSSVVRKESTGKHFPKDSLSLLQLDAQGRTKGKALSKIINGTLVQDSTAKYSFFAMPTSDPDSDSWLGCGASIISPTYGLTAAHCFGGGDSPCQGPKQLALWVGDLSLSPGGELSGKAGGKHARVLANATCHHRFDGKCSHGHDMVLLKLQDPLPAWVTPVKLDLDGVAATGVGEVTNNIGFGLRESPSDPTVISGTTPDSMREAKLTIFADDYKACASVYAGGYGCSDDASMGEAKNKDTQICAGATDNPQRDTCSGDSGSPMLDKHGVQIAIVSYGGGPGNKMSGPGRICADPEYMGVYTRVSALKQFITDHVKDLPYAGP